MTRDQLLVSVTLLLEVLATLYVSFVTRAFSGWFISDSAAIGMSPTDWYVTAAIRFIISVVAAALFAAAVFTANRSISRLLREDRYWFSVRVPQIAFAMVAMAGLWGSAKFAINKPFM